MGNLWGSEWTGRRSRSRKACLSVGTRRQHTAEILDLANDKTTYRSHDGCLPMKL